MGPDSTGWGGSDVTGQYTEQLTLLTASDDRTIRMWSDECSDKNVSVNMIPDPDFISDFSVSVTPIRVRVRVRVLILIPDFSVSVTLISALISQPGLVSETW